MKLLAAAVKSALCPESAHLENPQRLGSFEILPTKRQTLVLTHRLAVVALGFIGRMDETKLAARRFLELSPTI